MHRIGWILPLVFGCGGMTSPDGGAGDATTDTPSIDVMVDAPSDAFEISDGGKPDTGIKDATTSDAPHLQNKCASGAQCDGGGDVCCAALTFDNTNDKCLLDTVSSQCAPASGCPTTLQPFCGGAETVRECDVNADCLENEYPVCCTFSFDTTFTNYQTALRICASQAAANAADASCGP